MSHNGYNTCMVMQNNLILLRKIENNLDDILPVKLGVNKKNEVIRLIYEICNGEDVSYSQLMEEVHLEDLLENGKNGLFHRIKQTLVKRRYPSIQKDSKLRIMPLKIDDSFTECSNWDNELNPTNIYVEEKVLKYEWTKRFLNEFKNVETKIIENINKTQKQFIDGDYVSQYDARRKNIFLTKNKTTFIKICPCTKGCVRCGYWILNLGFGCPIDCTYCYLQMYSNAPGIILSANIEEYANHITEFDKKIGQKIRIGTGEFTDSLAFDDKTKYSSYLIPYFKNTKNLVLELKTKVSNIDNVLKENPHDNVVISWSINTFNVADRFEKGAGDVEERIKAARLAAEKGFKIGFHFDPIVYSKNWEEEYRSIIEKLFSVDIIRKKTVWISLGTLRYTPGLKQIAEKRFIDNDMFYTGEFYLDEDDKFRYPREVRIDMYNKIIKWIRLFNVTAWVYLCMEFREVWKKVGLEKRDYSFK